MSQSIRVAEPPREESPPPWAGREQSPATARFREISHRRKVLVQSVQSTPAAASIVDRLSVILQSAKVGEAPLHETPPPPHLEIAHLVNCGAEPVPQTTPRPLHPVLAQSSTAGASPGR